MAFDTLPENIQDMTDAEFEAWMASEGAQAGTPAAATQTEQQETQEEVETTTETGTVQTADVASAQTEQAEASTEAANADSSVAAEQGTQAAADGGTDPAASAEKEVADTTDWKAKYEEIMAPLHSLGAEIKLQTPAEARALLQKGIGYTRRMQELAPQRKLAMALQNAGLTDMDRVLHLIEVSKGTPAAIQKLLKDHNIDPLSLDPEQAAAYAPSTVAPSDGELRFGDELDEAKATEHGSALIRDIAGTWDAQSQEALGETPGMLSLLTAQKQSGVYDLIAGEIARRKALGQLPPVPFVQAYDLVGKEMNAAGLLTPAAKTQEQAPAATTQSETAAALAAAAQNPAQGNAGVAQAATQQPLAVRKAALVNKTAASKAAAAASPTRVSSSQTGKLTMDDLTKMTDEQIAALGPDAF